MITPLLSLLLAAKLVAHSGQIIIAGPRHSVTIEVQTCKVKPAVLYQDPKGVILIMGNSYETNSLGEYEFFTDSPYAVLNITYDFWQPPVVIRTCPEPERTHR